MKRWKHMRRNACTQSSLHSMDQFEYLVKCEQARADRTNSEFALLLFEKDDLAHHLGSPDEFILSAHKGLRLTDQVGWLDSQWIGMLLPNTSLTSGLSCMSSLRNRHFKHALGLTFRVASYPHAWHDQLSGPGLRRSRTYVLTDDDGSGTSSAVEGIRETPALPEERDENSGAPAWKRILDCFGASVGILLGLPVCLLVAAYILCVSPGPVLYRQKRIGRWGRPFTFFKLRTMKPSNDCSGHQEHLKGLINSDVPMTKLDALADPRLIPGAQVIRKLCLDELPQFVNVLRGEMSLVGPRPCLPYEYAEYSHWHARRFEVLPGMTGLWQVRGKNNLSFAQMIRHDIRYVESMSLALDLLILLMTLPAIMVYMGQALLRRTRGGATRRSVVPRNVMSDKGTLSLEQGNSERRISL
jgi:lipopolysaccharide/colanic/teichoic acid biosynthesis glycosyltransferase